ncbi:glycosyltransferase family 2 protein [Runella slithyformis]|uniref:Glycosyl transferase family 2 n=1 Tax=Runella slithyformis (strain ATCC 29530 / DSM 19594 / LMG 11500 / NCIMB 11436 / LSU 4) TaxID=761193 RepID=A0A7U3ZKX8_RUNSL|nr:glycosyltransferase family 2 protein [Runella slithyformis]AEI49057.1 glycosyl transferase family 2 [Runella slithyformis DSM 19594]
MNDVSVIILTHNEEKHIERCIRSLLLFTDKIFVVDSGSTDRTAAIAESLGAKVAHNPWVTYAVQFNFGIDHTPFKTDWLMRMDADEYVTPELANEIKYSITALNNEITGVYVKRRVMFMNQWIRHGGYYPIWLLRLWRRGKGICEELWMDEHIKLSEGETAQFKHDIVDHNLNNLTWWTQKHNNYAIREVIDLLDIKYNFTDADRVIPRLFGTQDQRKRFLKLKYASLPLFTRPFAYFVYRYFAKLGFLDGKKGLIWHFLQGLWYRFLVDAKMYEVYHRVGKDKQDIIEFFRNEYGKDLSAVHNRPVEIRQ